MLGTLHGARDTVMGTSDTAPSLMELKFFGGKIRINQIIIQRHVKKEIVTSTMGTLHDAMRLYFGSNSSFPVSVISLSMVTEIHIYIQLDTYIYTYVHEHCL